MQLFQIETRNISDILIKDRARNDVGDISSLADSISMVGQLHPILIDSDNVLIDGLHRIEAFKKLGKETIEVRVFDGITEDDHFLIELLSNMDRKEFLWHEEIELKYKLHRYWVEAAAKEGKSWGYRETAKRLKCSLGGLSTDLAFAEALKVFPILKEQSTKGRAKEAYKALGEQAKAIQRMDSFTEDEKERLAALQSGNIIVPVKNTVSPLLAEKTKKAKSKLEEFEEFEPTNNQDQSEDLYEDLDDDNDQEYEDSISNVRVIYVAENYKTFLNKIPEESVGMVELDPPYAIDFNDNYGKTNKIECKAQDWDEKELYDFYFNYLPLVYQKMLDASWCLIWTGKEHFLQINNIAKDIGFGIQSPGAWNKVGGSTNKPKTNMVSNWEMFLLLRKGNAQFNTPSLSSSINISTVSASQRIHQWEKPIELYDHFVKALGKPGTIFMSLFAGSGNCLISAAKAKMIPIGCDKLQKYIPQFYQRLENYLGISADVEGL